MPAAAHRFNLVVSALLFVMMLAFAGWVLASALAGGAANAFRIVAGAMICAAALTLLAAVRGAWRSGEPVQHSVAGRLGFALLAIGVTILVLG